MKALVIGGTGFVGSHIARALLESGADVWIPAESSCDYIGSAVELLISNSFFSMSQVGYVIPIGVIFFDLNCHASVEAFMLEGGDE